MSDEKKPKFHPNPNLKLMDQVREVLRYHHYAYRTEQTYCQWILRYIHYFGGKTHPKLLGAKNIEAFLSHLATEGQVTASTQRQALNALVFLYKHVLDIQLEEQIAPARSKRSASPPTVMTQAEVQRLLSCMEGKPLLMAKLIYGSGLRLMECIRLRLQDVDLEQNLIFVRGGKGGKDRTTILPQNLYDDFSRQIEAVKVLHHKDLEEGFGEVYVPEALARKYPRLQGQLAGSGFSPPNFDPSILVQEKKGVIMFLNPFCKKRSSVLPNRRVLLRKLVVIPCATVLPHICWKGASISAFFRNCSATLM